MRNTMTGGAARWLRAGVAVAGLAPVCWADQPAYLVSWHWTHSIRSYDRDGTYLGDFVPSGADGLSTPQHMDIGEDGILYVATWLTDSVRKYDAETGAFLGVLAQGGPLNGATWLEVEEGTGDILVTSNLGNRILRYDAATGTLLGDVIPAGLLVSPHEILRLGDGTMLVGSFVQNRIARFDEATGAYIEDFASGAPLAGPGGLELSADGTTLYVNNWNSGDILVYDVEAGAFVKTLYSDPNITNLDSIAFAPDGYLVVCSWSGNLVMRIDPETGEVVGTFESINDVIGPNEAMVLPACAADFNGDGEANVLDFVAFQAAFVGGEPGADCDGSGTLTVLDFVCFQQAFVAGCG